MGRAYLRSTLPRQRHQRGPEEPENDEPTSHDQPDSKPRVAGSISTTVPSRSLCSQTGSR